MGPPVRIAIARILAIVAFLLHALEGEATGNCRFAWGGDSGGGWGDGDWWSSGDSPWCRGSRDYFLTYLESHRDGLQVRWTD